MIYAITNTRNKKNNLRLFRIIFLIYLNIISSRICALKYSLNYIKIYVVENASTSPFVCLQFPLLHSF